MSIGFLPTLLHVAVFDTCSEIKTCNMLVNSQLVFALHQSKQILDLIQKMVTNLQSSKVKGTLQDSMIDLIIRKLNHLVVVDFRFISAFLHVLWAWIHTWGAWGMYTYSWNFYQLSFLEFDVMSSKQNNLFILR